jgi:hypothetical protein
MSDRQSGDKMGERGSEPASAGHGKAEGSGKSAESEGRDARDHERNRKSADSKEEIDRKSAETGSGDRRDRDRKAAETGNNDRMDREPNRESAEGGDSRRDRDHDRKGGAVKMSSDQKQKVRTYFSEHRPTAKRIDKSEVRVSIGVGIPAGIALAPLPPDVVLVAANCPLQYFLWGDDVVLVDSCSREVVDIIPNMG